MDSGIPMTVTGVRVELPSNTPIVLLREQAGTRFLPIWVGAVEAMAISSALDGITPARPMTHDLLRDVVGSLDVTVNRVVVTDLRNNVYYADLVLESQGSEVVVSSRPSDAIALAVRTGAPVFADRAILDAVGIEIEDESTEPTEDEIAQFRAMLEDITVEDFMGDDPELDSE